MAKSTRATLALKKVGINFKLHRYDYDPDTERIGLHAAEAIGIEPRRLLKTLMAEVDGEPVKAVTEEVQSKGITEMPASPKTTNDPDAERIGLHAAEAIGIEPRRFLKTLMAEVDGKPVKAVTEEVQSKGITEMPASPRPRSGSADRSMWRSRASSASASAASS